jgi:hypothetical protein
LGNTKIQISASFFKILFLNDDKKMSSFPQSYKIFSAGMMTKKCHHSRVFGTHHNAVRVKLLTFQREEMKKLFVILTLIFCVLSAKICVFAKPASVFPEYPHKMAELYPEYLLKMVQTYPETKPLLRWYDEMLCDPLYFERKIDISNDLATDGVPFFLQWDKRWAFLNCGKKTVMATSGCGPACLSMLICYYTKENAKNPHEVAEFSKANKYYTENVGTSERLFTVGAAEFSLKAEQIPVKPGTARSYLQQDKMIVALMRAGDFTKNGHYIIIKGCDGGETFYVNDPNSVINTKKSWNSRTLFRQIGKMWAVYK